MSRNLTLRFERDVAGMSSRTVEAYDLVKGKTLEKLDAIATRLGVKWIGSFWADPDVSHLPGEQQMALAMGHWNSKWGEEPERGTLWYDPADGLASGRALLIFLRDNPKSIRSGVRDLQEFEQALDLAQRSAVKFQFDADA